MSPGGGPAIAEYTGLKLSDSVSEDDVKHIPIFHCHSSKEVPGYMSPADLYGHTSVGAPQVRITRFKSPGVTINYMDDNGDHTRTLYEVTTTHLNAVGADPGAIFYRHNDQANAAFLDGHCAKVKPLGRPDFTAEYTYEQN